jgi:uncharacterized membrane protein YphA (DoxX/SURF4 family)
MYVSKSKIILKIKGQLLFIKTNQKRKNMNITIGIIQSLLSTAFLIAGVIKLILPKNNLKEKIGGWVDEFKESQIKLIGLIEVVGAFGLVLPMFLHVIPILTPIAAFGLVLTMIGAARTHLKRKESIRNNIVLLVLGVFVIIGRLFIVKAI